jgi:hypothetical protein
MARSVTFCKVPLSTSVDSRSARSFVTLDWLWVLSSGIPAHQFVFCFLFFGAFEIIQLSLQSILSISAG